MSKMEIILWALWITVGADTAATGWLISGYLEFRFHIAEKYVLRRDYREDIDKIFNKIDEVNINLTKIIKELAGKEDRR